MDQTFEQTAEQAAAFQKIWMDSATRIFQAAFTATPNSPPPEILRQIRSGIFQALAQSWDEFMRSPEFLASMRQWMENAISFQKLSGDLLAKVRNDLQAPSRGDVDSIMLTIRHLEKRLLDRMDDLSGQLAQFQANGSKVAASRPRSPRATRPGSKPARTRKN